MSKVLILSLPWQTQGGERRGADGDGYGDGADATCGRLESDRDAPGDSEGARPPSHDGRGQQEEP